MNFKRVVSHDKISSFTSNGNTGLLNIKSKNRISMKQFIQEAFRDMKIIANFALNAAKLKFLKTFGCIFKVGLFPLHANLLILSTYHNSCYKCNTLTMKIRTKDMLFNLIMIWAGNWDKQADWLYLIRKYL